MLSLIKSKFILIGGGIIAFLLAALKVMFASRKKAVQRADRMESALKRQSDIQEIDTELSKELKSRKGQIRKEIEENEEVTSLSNPNTWD